MREDAGLTRVQLGERIGLSKTAIRNIEVGESGSHLHTLQDWADACGRPLWHAFAAPSQRTDLRETVDDEGAAALELLASVWADRSMNTAVRATLRPSMPASSAII